MLIIIPTTTDYKLQPSHNGVFPTKVKVVGDAVRDEPPSPRVMGILLMMMRFTAPAAMKPRIVTPPSTYLTQQLWCKGDGKFKSLVEVVCFMISACRPLQAHGLKVSYEENSRCYLINLSINPSIMYQRFGSILLD